MAAGNSLQDIIGWQPILGLIKQQTDGLPSVLPPAFNTITRTVEGDTGRYTRVPGMRQLAKRVEYGAPSLRLEQLGLSDIPVKLLHFFNHIQFNPYVLIALRDLTSLTRQDMGRMEIARQTQAFAQRFDNTRNVAILMALANGTIWFDANGNLLPTASGALVTVDFAIPANNKTQVNGVIAFSWDNNSTDIPAQLRALKARAAQLTGYPIKYAFYGANIPTYFAQNDYVTDFLSRDAGMNGQYLRNGAGELPDGLFGLTWVPVYESFFQDANGTNQVIFDPDTIVFTPEPSRDWYEVLEGTVPVPTSIDIASDPMGAAGNVKEVAGRGGYGVVQHDPVTIRMYYFDTFLPVIKVPEAVFIAKVKF